MAILELDRIHLMQEAISRWSAKLDGIHTHSMKHELLDHLTGIGHFEVLSLLFKRPETPVTQYERDLKAKEFMGEEFKKALNLLNLSLVNLHSTYTNRLWQFSGKARVVELKKYAESVKFNVDSVLQRHGITRDELPVYVKQPYGDITDNLLHWQGVVLR